MQVEGLVKADVYAEVMPVGDLRHEHGCDWTCVVGMNQPWYCIARICVKKTVMSAIGGIG